MASAMIIITTIIVTSHHSRHSSRIYKVIRGIIGLGWFKLKTSGRWRFIVLFSGLFLY